MYFSIKEFCRFTFVLFVSLLLSDSVNASVLVMVTSQSRTLHVDVTAE